MSKLDVEYKEVVIDHSKPQNVSKVLADNGFNVARPIHTRRELFSDNTIYSQALGDLCEK